MTGGRAKPVVLAGLALLAGGVALAGSQPWQDAAVAGPTGSARTAVLAIGLAMLAVVGALAIAGRVLRLVLVVLEALLAACVVLVLAVAGEWDGGWPVVAVVAAGLAILASPVAIASALGWPSGTGRYSRTRMAGTGDPVADWDALSDGEDPTERPDAHR